MWRIFSLAILLPFLIAGCAPNVSPDSYSVGGVGQVNRVARGSVISVRNVDISGTESGVGAGAGALAGGVGGSAIGGTPRDNILGVIGGAVVGGIAGSLAEEGMTRQKGFEYVVETENGALFTTVQGGDTPLSVGQKVLIIYGARARVIPAP